MLLDLSPMSRRGAERVVDSSQELLMIEWFKKPTAPSWVAIDFTARGALSAPTAQAQPLR
jgi:hypothetical protein